MNETCELTPEAIEAMLHGRWGPALPEDYGLSIFQSTAPDSTDVFLKVLLVRSRDGLPIMTLADVKLGSGDTLTLSNLRNAFNVTVQ